MLLAIALGLPHSAMAITNAELARLNNELIGLDAQLAVAKKRSELEKYRATGGVSQAGPTASVRPASPRADEPVEAEAIPVRKAKRDTAAILQGTASQEEVRSPGKKPRPQ